MIRRAGPFDIPALALIHAAAFPPGEAWSAAILAGHLGIPGVFAMLAEPGGMIVARVAADEAEILTLAVLPAARRSGIGRGLIQAAEDFAAAAGARRMFLEVSTANAAARALYAGLGFTQLGHRPAYYPDGHDALVLSHALAG